MRRTSGPPPKPAPISRPGRMGERRTGMLSLPACPRQRVPDARSPPARPAKPVLAADQSAALRDRLVAELDALQSADEAASWAHRSLPAKNTLTAADAELVEAGFRAKLAAFGDGRPADGLREAVQGRPGRNRAFRTSDAEEPPAAATEVLAHVAAAGSGLDADNPRMDSGELNNPGSSIGGGIDKSVLAIGEPRRIRDKDHRKFVSSQACLICGRQPSDRPSSSLCATSRAQSQSERRVHGAALPYSPSRGPPRRR